MWFDLQGIKPNHNNHIPLSAFQLIRRTGANQAKLKLEPVQRVGYWFQSGGWETAATKHVLHAAGASALRSKAPSVLPRRPAEFNSWRA
jgi:hypothetical protein